MADIKINRSEIKPAYDLFKPLSESSFGIKVNFFILSVLSAVEAEYKLITSTVDKTAVDTGYDKIAKEQADIVRLYAKKDEGGNLIEGERPGTIQLEDVDGYNQAITDFLKKNKEAIENYNAQVQTLEKDYFTEEITIQAAQVSVQTLIDASEKDSKLADVLSPKNLKIILPFLKESMEEVTEVLLG